MYKTKSTERSNRALKGPNSKPSRNLQQTKRAGSYLIEDVWDVLLVGRLLDIAELRRVLGWHETVVSHKRHALVGDLVALKVYLVLGVTCTRRNTDGLRPGGFKSKNVNKKN